MRSRLPFEAKEYMVKLSGACFWYWNSFHSFLSSSGVPSQIFRRYPQSAFSKYDVMRNVIEDLEELGSADVLEALVSNFYRLDGPVDKDERDEAKARSLLESFREVVGSDPIERELERRRRVAAQEKHRESIDFQRAKGDELLELNRRFLTLSSLIDVTVHERGFEFERLFFDLLELSEFDCTRPYRTRDGEQIDGAFRYEKFDYLVEIKWVSGPVKQTDLSSFDGKIRGKAQSTRGFFLAAEGFDLNAVKKFSGDEPRIILMTGEDLALVLNGTIPMFDVMKAKVDAIVRHGNINFRVRDI